MNLRYFQIPGNAVLQDCSLTSNQHLHRFWIEFRGGTSSQRCTRSELVAQTIVHLLVLSHDHNAVHQSGHNGSAEDRPALHDLLNARQDSAAWRAESLTESADEILEIEQVQRLPVSMRKMFAPYSRYDTRTTSLSLLSLS